MNNIAISLHTTLYQNPFDVEELNHSPRQERQIVEEVCEMLGIRYDYFNDKRVVLTSPLDLVETHNRSDLMREKLRLQVGIHLIDIKNKYYISA